MTVSYSDDEDRPYLAPVPDDGPPAGTRNPVSERAVLGAILTDPEQYELVADHITGADFYSAQHEKIWDAIELVVARDQEPDPVTVATQLNRTGQLVSIGGAVYLHECMGECPMPRQAPVYAEAVRDAARLRAVHDVAARLRQATTTGDPDKVQRVLEDSVTVITDAAARFEPSGGQHRATGRHDLSWVGHDWPTIPPPVYGKREDGHALFYAGRVNGIFGDPEAAKTWLAMYAAVEALNDGGRYAHVDVDLNGDQLTVSRLLLLGARPEYLADPDRFRFYAPEDADELHAATREITAWLPTIVILDSIGEIFPMMGVKSVDNDEVTAAMRSVVQPPADAGACVIVIDHLPKSTEARATGYAIGGTAKKRPIRGSYIHAEVKQAPAPGGIGRIMLRIAKDTSGGLRATVPPGSKYLGDMVIDSTQEMVTTIKIGAGTDRPVTDEGIFRPTHIMETVSRLIEDTPGLNARAIYSTIPHKQNHTRAALQRLLEETYVTVQKGPRGAAQHFTVKPFRANDDTYPDPANDNPFVEPPPDEEMF